MAPDPNEGAKDDGAMWTDYIKKNPRQSESGAEVSTGEKHGVEIKKDGKPELLKPVNDVITAAKADGTYDTIYQKWFGTKPAS